LRVKAVIAYDGSRFYGSQVQRRENKNTHPTVAAKIEKLLNALNIKTNIEFSGRTDKGVHAAGQVIAFDIPQYWSDLEKLKNIINSKLNEIQFKTLEKTRDEFSPRYNAKKRLYRYMVTADKKSPFMYDYVAFVEKIDAKRIKDAIKLFEGTHDFAMFRKQGSEEKSTLRKIFKARFYRYKNFYIFSFEGSAFLRSQIRMMVAALLKISDGTICADELNMQIENRKKISSSLAPAQGLYLSKVKY